MEYGCMPRTPCGRTINIFFIKDKKKILFSSSENIYWAFFVIQSLSYVWLFATPWTAACQVSLSFTISQSLFKLMSIESMMPSDHLILCRPLLLLPSILPSLGVFSNELVLHIRWPKYWSFSISLSNEYSGLISFRINWLDLLAVQETLKILLQPDSSKASILQCSAFFMVQLSHPHMTTGKTIALTIQTFVAKWCLFFLISCLGCHSFPSKEQASFNIVTTVTVHSDFGAQENKNKISHHFQFFPSICLEMMSWSLFSECSILSWSIISISEAVDISPSNLDSNLWFIQPGILHDVFCI